MNIQRLLLVAFLVVSSGIHAQELPKISIVTSVYDGDAFIEGFLCDITQQTVFDQCELIILNAASPGNEEPIIQSYAERYPNIIYQRLDSDPGIYGTWNIAVKKARGKYITNANLDDRLAHNCYEVHAAYLDSHESVDFVYSDKYITYIPNETFACHTGVTWPPSPQATRDSMQQCWPCSNPMWRSSLHTRFGLFDETYKSSGDWEMWLRAFEGGACLQKISGYYLLYYHNPKGLSTGKRDAEKKAEDKRIVDRYGYMWGAQTYAICYATARFLDEKSNESPYLWPSAMDLYLKAYELKPHRAEPLIRIALYYTRKADPAPAHLFASKAATIACPASTEELVEHELYDYVRYDILGQTAWYVNEFQEGEDALRTVIKTHGDMHHLRNNLDFYTRRAA